MFQQVQNSLHRLYHYRHHLNMKKNVKANNITQTLPKIQSYFLYFSIISIIKSYIPMKPVQNLSLTSYLVP